MKNLKIQKMYNNNNNNNNPNNNSNSNKCYLFI